MRPEARFQGVQLIYQFEDYSLDVDRQELRRGTEWSMLSRRFSIFFST